MARITRGMTDEYSDYDLSRRMMGIGGTVAFGITAGYAVMQLNNSAFLKSLGNAFESSNGYKPFDNSIIGRGNALNKSILIRQAIERNQSFGQGKDINMANRIQAKQMVPRFLDEVLANNEERIKTKTIDKMDTLDTVENEVEVKARKHYPTFAEKLKEKVESYPAPQHIVSFGDLKHYAPDKQLIRNQELNKKNIATHIEVLQNERKKEIKAKFDYDNTQVTRTDVGRKKLKQLRKETNQSYDKRITDLNDKISTFNQHTIDANSSIYRELSKKHVTKDKLKGKNKYLYKDVGKELDKLIKNSVNVIDKLGKITDNFLNETFDILSANSNNFSRNEFEVLSDLMFKLNYISDGDISKLSEIKEMIDEIRYNKNIDIRRSGNTFSAVVKDVNPNLTQIYTTQIYTKIDTLVEDIYGERGIINWMGSLTDDFVKKHSPLFDKDQQKIIKEALDNVTQYNPSSKFVPHITEPIKLIEIFTLDNIETYKNLILDKTENETFIDKKQKRKKLRERLKNDQLALSQLNLSREHAKTRSLAFPKLETSPDIHVDKTPRLVSEIKNVSFNESGELDLKKFFSDVAENTKNELSRKSNGRFILNTYQRMNDYMAKGRTGTTKYSHMHLSTAIMSNPLSIMEDTSIPFLKRVTGALKEQGNDVDLGAKLVFENKDSFIELTINATKDGQKNTLKIKVPRAIGNTYLKGGNLLVMPGIYNTTDVALNLKNGLQYYFDSVEERILGKPNAQKAAIELTSVQSSVNAIANQLYGNGGKFGITQYAAAQSSSELRRSMTQVIDLNTHRRNDGQYKKYLLGKKAKIQEAWHNAQFYGTGNAKYYNELRDVGKDIDKQLKELNEGYTKTLVGIMKAVHAKQINIGNVAFSHENFLHYLNTVGPDILLSSPQNVLNKGMMTLDRASAFMAGQDIARGTKKYSMIADTYQQEKLTFSFQNAQYNLNEGLSLKENIEYNEVTRFRRMRNEAVETLRSQRNKHVGNVRNELFKNLKKLRNAALKEDKVLRIKIKETTKKLYGIKNANLILHNIIEQDLSTKVSVPFMKNYFKEATKKAREEFALYPTDIVDSRNQQKIDFFDKRLDRLSSDSKRIKDRIKRINFESDIVAKKLGINDNLGVLHRIQTGLPFDKQTESLMRTRGRTREKILSEMSQNYVDIETGFDKYGILLNKNKLEAYESLGFIRRHGGGGFSSAAAGYGLVPVKMWITNNIAELGEGATYVSEEYIKRNGMQITRDAGAKGIEISHLKDTLKTFHASADVKKVLNNLFNSLADGKTFTGQNVDIQTIINKFGLSQEQAREVGVVLNDILNTPIGSGKKGFIKTAHQSTNMDNRSRALFQSLSVDNDGKLFIKYDLISEVGRRSKVYDEFANKYVIQQVLTTQEMLEKQRYALLQGEGSIRTFAKDTRNNSLLALADRILGGKVPSSETDSVWREIVENLKGVNNKSFIHVAKSLAENTQRLMSREMAAEIVITNKQHLKGKHFTLTSESILQTTLNQSFDIKAVRKLVRNDAGKKVVESIFGDIISLFSKNQQVGVTLSESKGRKNKRDFLKPEIAYTMTEDEASKSLLHIFDKQDNAIVEAKFDNEISNKINNKISEAQSNGLLSSIEAQILRKKIKDNIKGTLASFKNGINNVQIIGKVMLTGEDPYELNTTTNNRYDHRLGYSKGASISLPDALLLKTMGFSKLHSHIMEHANHGRQFMDNYMSTYLEMMGLDPAEYLNQEWNKRSQKTRVGQASAKLNKDVLEVKELMKEMDPVTNMRRLKGKGPGGLLGNISKEFTKHDLLNKVRLSVEQLRNLETKYTGKNANPFTKILQEVEESVKQNVGATHYEMDLKKLREMLAGDDELFVRAVRESTAHIDIDDVRTFKKLLHEYRGIDYKGNTEFKLFDLNSRGSSKVHFARFGWNDEIDTLVNSATGKVVRTGDINHITKNNILIHENASNQGKNLDFLGLNEALRAQLSWLKLAASGEIGEATLNSEYNRLATNVASVTRRTTHQMTNKRLGSTVKGIGMVRSNIRLDRLNAWSILKEVSGGLDLGIKGVMDLSKVDAEAKLQDILTNKDYGQKARNIFTDFLSAGKEGFTPGMGEVFMDQRQFQSTLSQAVGIDKGRSITAEVMKGQQTYMTMGIRYPTNYSTNIAPMITSIYDSEILRNLQKQGIKDESFNSFLSSASQVKNNLFINALEGKLRGGDFDRDQYAFINALRGANQAVNDELKENFIRHSKVTFQNKIYNDGTNSFIVSGEHTGFRAKASIKALAEAISDEDPNAIKILKGGDIQVVNKKIQSMLNNGYTFDAVVKKYHAEGSKKRLVDAMGVDNKDFNTRFLVDAKNGSKASLAFRESILGYTKKLISVLYLEDDELEKLAKRKRTSVDALLLDEHRSQIAQFDSHARTLKNLGFSTSEIEAELKLNKEAMAAGLEFAGSSKYATNIEKALTPLVGVKATTGLITNVMQYGVHNILSSIPGISAAQIVAAKDWTGNVIQGSISSKHNIPVTTSDVVSSIQKLLNPNSSKFEVMIAKDKFITGSFKAELTHSTIGEWFQHSKVIGDLESHADNSSQAKAIQEIKKMRADRVDARGNYIERNGFTLTEWNTYIKNKLELVESNKNIRSVLGVSKDDITELRGVAIDLKKSIGLASDREGAFFPHINAMREFTRINGMDNMSKVMNSKVLLTKAEQSATDVARATRRIAGGLDTSAYGTEVMNYLFDRNEERLGRAQTGAYFHTESVSVSTSRHMSERLSKMSRSLGADAFVDTASIAKKSFGGLLGMAAIGFIGAFALQSNKREWLGSTAGFGGEYAERQNRKDEDSLANKNVLQRLQNRNVKMPYLHAQRAKDVHLMSESLNKRYGDTPMERLRRLNNPEMIDQPMQFKL